MYFLKKELKRIIEEKNREINNLKGECNYYKKKYNDLEPYKHDPGYWTAIKNEHEKEKDKLKEELQELREKYVSLNLKCYNLMQEMESKF